MPLIEAIESMKDEMTQWRRDIHAHPELGFEEKRTSYFVARKLKQFGIDVVQGIGNTGVVGVLREGNEHRSIGLRADMDALPIEENNTFEHKSKKANTMHACGHDGHTTMLLGAAKYLAETRNFSGQVNFIFQPAEEGIGGARAMIADGLFEQFPCDQLFAMHNGPGLPVGHFSAVPGIRTAAGAFFDINVKGKGAHGAFPDQGIDPIVIAAEIVTALQSIISRNTRPSETAVLSVTQMHAGDAYNVIPSTARLSGTVRTMTLEMMQKVEGLIRQRSHLIANAHGGSASVSLRTVFHPVLNDEATTSIAADVCGELVGADKVVTNAPPGTGSEDFSFMSEKVPSCYLILGNGDSGALHNPDYDFNDDATVYGASFFARVVEKVLEKDEG